MFRCGLLLGVTALLLTACGSSANTHQREAQITAYFADPLNAFITTTGATGETVKINSCTDTGATDAGEHVYDCGISITGRAVLDANTNPIDSSNLDVCFIFPVGAEAVEINPNTVSGAASVCPNSLYWLGDAGPFEYDQG